MKNPQPRSARRARPQAGGGRYRLLNIVVSAEVLGIFFVSHHISLIRYIVIDGRLV